MKTNNTQVIFSTVHILFWIAFIGLCIKTGAIIISFLVSLFINPEGAQNLFEGLDLSALFESDKGHYILFVALLIALSGLKAYMAYLVIRLFSKIDIKQPFNTTASGLITNISGVALNTGILAIIGDIYIKWLYKKPVDLHNLYQHLDNGGEILFLAGIIFVIAKIFKKGVEIQSENELTV